MAGTLTISTLSDGTNSTSSTNCIQGSAKAWVRFNGVTTTTINASYNVSSVTRNATGTYTINFTNAISDANYSVNYNLDLSLSTTNNDAIAVNINSITTSSFKLYCYGGYAAGSLADQEYVACSIFR